MAYFWLTVERDTVHHSGEEKLASMGDTVTAAGGWLVSLNLHSEAVNE